MNKILKYGISQILEEEKMIIVDRAWVDDDTISIYDVQDSFAHIYNDYTVFYINKEQQIVELTHVFIIVLQRAIITICDEYRSYATEECVARFQAKLGAKP